MLFHAKQHSCRAHKHMDLQYQQTGLILGYRNISS